MIIFDSEQQQEIHRHFLCGKHRITVRCLFSCLKNSKKISDLFSVEKQRITVWCLILALKNSKKFNAFSYWFSEPKMIIEL